MADEQDEKTERKRPGRKAAEVPTVQVALRLDPRIVEKLREDADGVPLATWIARILKQYTDAIDEKEGRQ